MSAYLLDTNVVSELTRPSPDPGVLLFYGRETNLWLSVVTLHELRFGAVRIADPARRESLNSWIDSIAQRFADRIIAVEGDIAEMSGRARGVASLRGRTVSPLDALIASTANYRGLILATRNLRDFEALEVKVFSPWMN